MSNIEKTKLGYDTFSIFYNQFGNDIYSQILLEVLLEGLMNEETLFIFGKEEQARDQIDNCIAG